MQVALYQAPTFTFLLWPCYCQNGEKKVAFAALEAWLRCHILFPNTAEVTGIL